MLFNNESAAVISEEVVTSEISKYELGLNGGLMHVYEIESAFNEMMESIGISELRYYVESDGGDVSQTENGKAKIGAKIKAFIDMVVRKIEEIFNRAVAQLGKLECAAFLKAFKKKLDLKQEDFKSFKFKKRIGLGGGSEIANAIGRVGGGAEAIGKGDFIGYMSKLAGKKCENTKDFSAALKEKFYIKDAKEEELEYADFSLAKKNLGEYKSWTSTLMKSKKELIKDIKQAIKDKETATDIADAKNSITALTLYVSVALGALLSIMKESKAICTRALAAAKKADKKGENDKAEEPKEEKKDAKTESAGPEPGSDNVKAMAELFAQVEIL